MKRITQLKLLGAAALVSVAGAAIAQPAPLKVFGASAVVELGPVLLAADKGLGGPSTVSNGGVQSLFNDSGADLATNAETQALRVSLDHPDLRIIMTVTEGLYRIVGKRSSGLAKLSDLKGKKIGTTANASSAYFVAKMLQSVGLTEADVTIVSMFPNKMPEALKSGQVDAIGIWEPETENAAAAVGSDAIEFDGKGVYRELFNLNARAGDLADPAKRARIVAYVRGLIAASKEVRQNPSIVSPLVSKSSKYDVALLDKIWKHEAFNGGLAPDLLDVLVDEDVWVAKEKNRAPRSRAELAKLIDPSIIKEAAASK